MKRSCPVMLLLLLLVAPASLIAQATTTPGERYLSASDSSRLVGERYMKAYFDLDWDTIEAMLATDATFQDPTAELVFGGVLVSGRAAMMNKFRNGYSGVQMSFKPTRAIHSGHYAIYEGELTWSAPTRSGGRVTAADSPFALMLRIEGGKVVEHRDYADYHPYIEAARR